MSMPEPVTTLGVAIKHLFGYIVAGLLALLGYFGKKLYNRVDKLEEKVVEIDKYQAVQAAQLIDIKKDIHDISVKLDKIIDRLQSK